MVFSEFDIILAMVDAPKGADLYPRRVVASFKRHQLIEIIDWFVQANSVSGKSEVSFEMLAESIPNEKLRSRYLRGILTLLSLERDDVKLDDISEVLVWQTTPDGSEHMYEYKYHRSSM